MLVNGFFDQTKVYETLLGTLPFWETSEMPNFYWIILLIHDRAQEQEIKCLCIHKNELSHIYSEELLLKKEIRDILILRKFWNSVILLKYFALVWTGSRTSSKMPLGHTNSQELF